MIASRRRSALGRLVGLLIRSELTVVRSSSERFLLSPSARTAAHDRRPIVARCYCTSNLNLTQPRNRQGIIGWAAPHGFRLLLSK